MDVYVFPALIVCAITLLLSWLYGYQTLLLRTSVLPPKGVYLCCFALALGFYCLLFHYSVFVMYAVAYLLPYLWLAFYKKDQLSLGFFVINFVFLNVFATFGMSYVLISLATEQGFGPVLKQLNLVEQAVLFGTLLQLISFRFFLHLFHIDDLRQVIRMKKLRLIQAIWMLCINGFLWISFTVSVESDQFFLLMNVEQFCLYLLQFVSAWGALYFNLQIRVLLDLSDENRQLEKLQESLMTNTVISFMFDVTDNQFIRGQELLFAQSEEELEGKEYEKSMQQILSEVVHKDDLEYVLLACNVEAISGLHQRGETEISIEYRRKVSYSEEEYHWVRLITNLFIDDVNQHLCGHTYVIIVDKERKSRQALEREAQEDGLTGLFNKKTTEKLVSQELSRGGAFFMVDIDYFKSVNDTLGHTQGDLVIQDCAASLRALFRGYDVVGRFGGDEFIVFCLNLQYQDIVNHKAQEICDTFRKSYGSEDGAIQGISASVGVYMVAPHSEESFEAVLEKADSALYASKKKGRNTYTIYRKENNKMA